MNDWKLRFNEDMWSAHTDITKTHQGAPREPCVLICYYYTATRRSTFSFCALQRIIQLYIMNEHLWTQPRFNGLSQETAETWCGTNRSRYAEWHLYILLNFRQCSEVSACFPYMVLSKFLTSQHKDITGQHKQRPFEKLSDIVYSWLKYMYKSIILLYICCVAIS